MSSQTFQFVRGIVLLVMFVGAAVWFLWRWLKGSRDPAALFVRWILTALALGFLGYTVSGVGDASGQLIAVLFGCVGGLFLAFVWAPVIVDFVSRKIGSLYDGGDAEVDPKPFYSIFHANRQKGKYLEALAEARRQLDKFPIDCEGQMLLAELQAENLNDLPGAEITIHRFCAQPGHAPANIADGLNRLADWHLKLAKDRDSARLALEKIIELLPGTEMSLVASQRIARLAGTEALLEAEHRQGKIVKEGPKYMGLLQDHGHLQRAETDPAQVANDYVRHLEQHPLDTHAREKLSVIYANHFHRLDLALDQLEQLVQQPGHPPKQIVHWLNLMADLQIQENAGPEPVRATLQRIVELFPDIAAAATAQRRIDTLKFEMRSKEKGHEVRLGTYEQNIGLKGTSIPPDQRPSFSPIK